MKYCTNCGTKIVARSKFCTNCGNEIVGKSLKEDNKVELNENIHVIRNVEHDVIKTVNEKIKIENNQTSVTRKFIYAAVFFLGIVLLAFLEIIPVHPAIIMLSIFLFISSIVVGFMFRNRSKKMQKLISGESLIASWKLTSDQKNKYSDYLFKNETAKNRTILYAIATISIIIFGVFIMVIDEGKVAMFGVLVSLLFLLSIFAFGMPYYYRNKNGKGDGIILIGAKYAYVNGYFHNWDFILSGLSKLKIIENPFHGIKIEYYYTDRTLKQSEEMCIPATEDIDLESLVEEMKKHNTKNRKTSKK